MHLQLQAVVISAIVALSTAQTCPQPLAVGSNLTIYPCGDPSRFSWDYVQKSTPFGPQFLQLRSDKTICLAIDGVYDSPNGPLTNVGTASCDPSSYYQGWYIQPNGMIISSLDASVLDVYDLQTTPGTRVDAYSSSGMLDVSSAFADILPRHSAQDK